MTLLLNCPQNALPLHPLYLLILSYLPPIEMAYFWLVVVCFYIIFGHLWPSYFYFYIFCNLIYWCRQTVAKCPPHTFAVV